MPFGRRLMRRPASEPAARIGADIGGTFTDIAFVDGDGRLSTHKVVSTPPDFGRAVADVVERLHADGGIGPGTEVIHGTTVATNAILERRGARTALLTTAGFRDVLELRRARSPELYDARYVPPPPLVERRWRLEVDERVGPDGRVLVPIDEAAVRRTIAFLEAEGIEAVAVCLLHSFRNPAHERAIGRLLDATSAYTSLSVDLLPVIGEYERTSTTVVNAYIGPVVSRYVLELATDLRRIAGIERLQVMQSNGGLMSAARAARQPAQIVESGPAGGVIAGVRLGEASGARDLICLDMGGTTAKASVIEGGVPSLTQRVRGRVGDLAVEPDVEGPRLRAQAAGARHRRGRGRRREHRRGRPARHDPGRAAQRRRGSRAGLLRGGRNARHGHRCQRRPRLRQPGGDRRGQPDDPPGPRAPGDPRRRRRAAGAVGRGRGTRRLRGRDGDDGPRGQSVTTYRGRDPRDFALLAFGGNGPIFAAALAESLGMRHVLVPSAAGVFSALGLLEAEETWHLSHSLFEVAAAIDPDDLAGRFRDARVGVAR